MKKLLAFILLVVLTGCSNNVQVTEKWGSFTSEKTYSYDDKFYAVQTVAEKEDASYIIVDIYAAENEEKIYSFSPARVIDFWGICWEKDTYNIWIQSADIGILCYKYDNDVWLLNEDVVRPEYIKSKYD